MNIRRGQKQVSLPLPMPLKLPPICETLLDNLPDLVLPGVDQNQPFIITVTMSAYDLSRGYAIAKLFLNGQLHSTTYHSRVSASAILTYTIDLGSAYAGWSSDRSSSGFQGNMYHFAAYMQELSAIDVLNEFNGITNCPAGQTFSMSLFQCLLSYFQSLIIM